MELRPVCAKLFHADRQMDWNDKTDSRFKEVCERA
jgi:hypothetical protein